MILRALLMTCIGGAASAGPVCTAVPATGAAGTREAVRLCAAAVKAAPDGRFTIEVTALGRTSLSARLTPQGAGQPGPELSVSVHDLDHIPDPARDGLVKALLAPPPHH